jgi:choline dehydrogenase
MIDVPSEARQTLLDQAAIGRLPRTDLHAVASAAGLADTLHPGHVDQALAAAEVQAANRAPLRASYDYIVVGAGTAGCVVAAELSASGAQVLLLESGGEDAAATILNPSVWFYNVGGPLDYKLQVAPSPRLGNRKFSMALGHVLGGGSSINAMVWARGLQGDYDGWAQNGAAGWAFKDVLPVFKAQEDWEGGANEWRGVGGPVHIRRPHDPHPTAPAFLAAARQMGFAIHDDLNGPAQVGAGYINMNIAPDGSRVSAVRAFLRPALARPNLTLLMNTDVLKVTFSGKRATGVRAVIDGAVTDIVADREVILTAGAVQSAKLLMLSGVGDAAALRPLGINVVENLPGVGQNLQDHILVSGVIFKYRGKMPERPADSDAVEAEVYLASGEPGAGMDIALVLEQIPVVTPEAAARFGAAPPDSFTIAPALVQPTSRGAVRLASAAPSDPLIIDGAYLGTDRDLKALTKAIEAAREMGRQTALDAVRDVELMPGPSASVGEVQEFARLASGSFGHAVGTCKIGVDEMAVVDPQLRVRGLERLRVADSSVMPNVIAGPGTNASTFMVAGKASQLILG